MFQVQTPSSVFFHNIFDSSCQWKALLFLLWLFFSQVDSNGDGRVSLDEFLTAKKKKDKLKAAEDKEFDEEEEEDEVYLIPFKFPLPLIFSPRGAKIGGSEFLSLKN